MDWWYWFGMWTAGVTSLIVTWWAMIDSFRRDGSILRFMWPLVAIVGCVLQLPAFTLTTEAQAAEPGAIAALSGLFGTLLVGIAAVAHFTRSAGAQAAWASFTRSSESLAPSGRDRRVRTSPRAEVPLPRTRRAPGRSKVADGSSAASGNASPVVPDAIVPEASADAMPASGTSHPVKWTPAAGSADHEKTVLAADDETVFEDNENTVLADDALDATTDATRDEDHLRVAETTATLLEEPPAERQHETAETIIVEPETDETVLDEPEPVEGPAAKIVITDGRSDRIIITDRTGPFVVGRDPSKCSLAVDDSKASRRHFSVNLVDGMYVITDLDSSNGTFLNGTPVRNPAVLNDGDTIEFGKTIARFVME